MTDGVIWLVRRARTGRPPLCQAGFPGADVMPGATLPERAARRSPAKRVVIVCPGVSPDRQPFQQTVMGGARAWMDPAPFQRPIPAGQISPPCLLVPSDRARDTAPALSRGGSDGHDH